MRVPQFFIQSESEKSGFLRFPKSPPERQCSWRDRIHLKRHDTDGDIFPALHARPSVKTFVKLPTSDGTTIAAIS